MGEQYMHNHTTVFADAHLAMVLVASGSDDLLERFLESMMHAAYDKPFYTKAGMSPDAVQPDPVDDADWDWAWQDGSWTPEQFRQAYLESANEAVGGNAGRVSEAAESTESSTISVASSNFTAFPAAHFQGL